MTPLTGVSSQARVEPQTVTRPAPSGARLILWSVRRELWQNRSLTLAPLIAAGILLSSFLLGTGHLAGRMRLVAALDPVQRHELVARPYGFIAAMIALSAFLAGVFYCAEALHGERRDRSILFWKSLPVSDLTSVMAKASVPLIVLPLYVFAVTVATQAIMLLVSTAVLLGNRISPAMLWTEPRLLEMPLVLLYGLAGIALLHAPLYGWLLLVSGWARRTPILWAVLPPFAVAAGERLAFDSSHITSLLGDRVMGGFEQAFAIAPTRAVPPPVIDRLTQLDPAKFLSSPDLWIGLGLTAIFLAAAVRLRRDREPN